MLVFAAELVASLSVDSLLNFLSSTTASMTFCLALATAAWVFLKSVWSALMVAPTVVFRVVSVVIEGIYSLAT